MSQTDAPSAEAAAPDETLEIAENAGLCYVTDEVAGITRARRGRGFSYRLPDGSPVTDRRVLDRIRALAVPPAWTDVWICPDPDGHLQATGRDARGRKQYRYHDEWRTVRDAANYDRIVEFARCLPRIRRRIEEDLSARGMPREKVLAAVVTLLDQTMMRIGNAEYARLNNSFGATTLLDRHAKVNGSAVRFTFRGKSGRQHELEVVDPRLARVVGRCQELPGQELFGYVDDDGVHHDIASQDVNDYLRDIAGTDCSAKDLRTFGGTVLAALALADAEPPAKPAEGRRVIAQAVREVAAELGNTPAVARSSYIHPAIVDGYLDGSLPRGKLRRARTPAGAEQVVLDYLEEHG